MLTLLAVAAWIALAAVALAACMLSSKLSRWEETHARR